MAGFDVRTILIILFLGDLAAIAALLPFAGKRGRDSPAILYVVALACQAGAWILLYFRGSLPDFLSVIVGNSLIFAGFAGQALALGTVEGRVPAQERAYGAILAVCIPAFAILSSMPALRVAAASTALVAIFGYLAFVMLSSGRPSATRRIIGATMVAYAAIHAARATEGLIGGADYTLFTPDAVQALSFYPLIVFLIMGSVGFVLLLVERETRRLRESEEKYRTVAENASEAILIVQDERIVYANGRACRLFCPASVELLTGRALESIIWPEDRAQGMARHRARVAGSETVGTRDIRMLRSGGEPFWISYSATRIHWNSRPAILALLSDIDLRKRQEEDVRRLLAEKELLLREVNHRVKNNLNVAIGLLSSGAAEAAGKAPEDVLREAISRLEAIGTLYDRLHEAGSSGGLTAGPYFRALVSGIVGLFPDSASVRLDFEVEDFSLPISVLSTLGILVNEIVTNAMKYAFAGIAEPVFTFSLRSAEGRLLLGCADNGRGLPRDFESREGFGLTLVRLLATQLGGELSVEGPPGAVFRLSFPAPA